MGALCCTATPVDFDGEVSLFHFSLLRVVGKGAFGKVRIVQHKQTRETYALKYINKARCVKMKAVSNIIQERKLLEKIDHPFVVNLRYAFQDDENCFFVLDLMLGGDLRFHLQRLRSLDEATVRFYVAELASAVAYLHDRRILHRDIKPDNILLDAAGHAHLTDFNVASHYSLSKPLTSVAGSMAYIAPEVTARKGYTYTPDWWSLGVTAYEVLFGSRPYTGRNGEELISSIKKGIIPKFFADPDGKCSPEGIQVLQGLLEKDLDKRLGCEGSGGFAALKAMPWFDDLDWDLLETKGLQPPMVPDTKHPNFDPSHELEEILLEDNPLRAKRRTKDLETMSPEMKKMEEFFKPYDYRQIMREQISTTFTNGAPVTPLIDTRFESMVDQRLDATVTGSGCVRTSDASAPVSPVDQQPTPIPPLPHRKSKSSEQDPRALSPIAIAH